MDITIFVLGIIAAIVVAQILNHLVPQIPVPLWEIVLGMGLAAVPQIIHFELDPEVFLLGIIAPLMFNDGQNTNRRALTRDISSVLLLSVGLVVLTAILVAAGVTWVDPTYVFWPIFIMVALMSPTDATAVSGITAQVSLPERLMNLLEGESLFNDATGIVAFNFGLSSLVAGDVQIGHGVMEFLMEFFGGILLGLLLGYVFVVLRIMLQRAGIDQSGVMVPIQLATPFIIYLIGDAVHVSGILAVVAAGIMHGMEKDRLQLSASRLQVVTKTVWDVLSDILNGVVFVILGIVLPAIFTATKDWQKYLGFAVLLYIIMFAIRWLYIRFFIRKDFGVPAPRAATLLTVFGSHGTVTLALALSLPNSFPNRNAVIEIAALVILLSLLIPTISGRAILPPVAGNFGPDVDTARNQMLVYVIDWLDKEVPTSPEKTAVLSSLHIEQSMQQHEDTKKVLVIFKQAEQVEEAALKQAVAAGQLDERSASVYERYLQVNSLENHNHFFKTFMRMILFRLFGLIFRRRFKRNMRNWSPEIIKQKQDMMVQAENIGYDAVQSWLSQQPKSPAITQLQLYYEQRHQHTNRDNAEEDIVSSLYTSVFQQKYQYVNQQLADKAINETVAKQLREQISYDEMVYMQQ